METPSASDGPRPNVVLILCHDLGHGLGCYGAATRTPNLDALARQGVLFGGHFCAGVTASPSRGSLMTGCYPHTHGLMGQLLHGWGLNVEQRQALPRVLSLAGYETHLFGFQHEHVAAERLGYRHVHRLPSFFAEDVAAGFAQWLAGRPARSRPFYASLGFWEAHRLGLNPSHFRRDVYTPPEPADVQVPAYLPDLPAVREDLAGFYGAVQHTDAQVARVLQALDEHGLRRNTLVILTGDGGPSFMHAKGTLYDAGLHVALLMSWPEGLPAGRRVSGLTSQVDVLPTILDLLDLPIPSRVQGCSVRDLIEGREARGRQAIFAEKNHERGFAPARMVRTEALKYVRKATPSCIYDEVLQELELSRGNFRENPRMFDYYSARRVTEELYDLARDPAELHNEAENPAWAEALADVRRRLDAHLQATADPFENTHVELPTHPESYERIRDARRAHAG